MNINLGLYNNLQWAPGKGDMARINTILELVGNNKKVLDIGCYDGQISELVKNAGNDVYGIEGAENAVEIARKRGIKVFKLNIETDEFPFQKDEFDVVIAAEIIEHMYNTDAFLEKIKRVLRQGGVLVLTTPNLAALGRRLMLLLGMNPYMEVSCRFSDPGISDRPAGGHLRYFVRENLIKLIELHGFKVIDVRSDIVNFNKSGTLSSSRLARLFPSLGKSIIVKAEKVN